MVAAMLRTNENDNAAIRLRTNDLRNIAIGLAAAIALIMVAGQIHDSGSASGSALEDTADKRFIAITAGQSANVAENTAANGAVMTVTTDVTPTGCSIATGDTDVDGDGPVGFGDVLAVLSNWGPCDKTP